jgi:hypothetical protein
LPPLDRKAFWLLLAGKVGALASRQQMAVLLRLGPEMEQFEALRRVLSRRAV